MNLSPIVLALIMCSLIVPFSIFSNRTGFSKKVADSDRKKYLFLFLFVSVLLVLFVFLTFLALEIAVQDQVLRLSLKYALYRTIRYSIPVYIVIALTIYQYWKKNKK
ncbi:hypothetical protein SDC9_44944 [bioreactor metagenome]|uniref:Uncharacterized protein n=1 Tax=bioreactor metagenome TaxID=1076179 RepID=A0A644W594_9ZZZZ